MKVDLDDLEHKARLQNHGVLCAEPPCCCCAPVTIALIARIRELEAAAREVADAPHRHAQAGRIGIMRSVLDKGVVLP